MSSNAALEFKQKPFYSYNDAYGQGINPEHLITYSESLIFDHQNRTIYAKQHTFGNHFSGSYHGEVFNDFERNAAYGNYSSVHGANNAAYNIGEAAVGHDNLSVPGSGLLFTVGNGRYDRPKNAFEVYEDGNIYAEHAATAYDFYLQNADESKSLRGVGKRLDEVESYAYTYVGELSYSIEVLPKFGTVVVEKLPQMEYEIATDSEDPQQLADEEGRTFDGDIWSEGADPHFKPKEDKIYLLKTSDEPNDEYDEYVIINSKWERIGQSTGTLKKTFATLSYVTEEVKKIDDSIAYLEEEISGDTSYILERIDEVVSYLSYEIDSTDVASRERDYLLAEKISYNTSYLGYSLEHLAEANDYAHSVLNGHINVLNDRCDHLQSEIDQIPIFEIRVVEKLPQIKYEILTDGVIAYQLTDDEGNVFDGDTWTEGAAGDAPSPSTIYLLKVSDDVNYRYDKYIIVNGSWEKIGHSNAALLEQFYTKEQVDQLLSDIDTQYSYLDTKIDDAYTYLNTKINDTAYTLNESIEEVSYASYVRDEALSEQITYNTSYLEQTFAYYAIANDYVHQVLNGHINVLNDRCDTLSYNLNKLSEEVLYSSSYEGTAYAVTMVPRIQFVEVTNDVEVDVPSGLTRQGTTIKVIYYNNTENDVIITTPSSVITTSGTIEQKTVKASAFNDITFICGPGNMIFAE